MCGTRKNPVSLMGFCVLYRRDPPHRMVLHVTRESTKTESFATNAYKNPDDDPSLDTVKANIHTGWYVGGTPESKT
jgi:hypothetical protein